MVKLSQKFDFVLEIPQKKYLTLYEKKIRPSNFQHFFFSMSFINSGNLKESKILDDLPWNEPINKNQNIQKNENYKLVNEKVTMKTKKKLPFSQFLLNYENY